MMMLADGAYAAVCFQACITFTYVCLCTPLRQVTRAELP